MKALEEEEKREEYLESIGDVKRQGNLDGFYRHLYDQKVNYEERDNSDQIEKSKQDDTTKRKREDNTEEESKERTKVNIKERKYRKRDQSSDDEDIGKVEMETSKKEHLPSNLDADSDFSIDSESDVEEDNGIKIEKKQEEIPSNVKVNDGVGEEEIKAENDTVKIEKGDDIKVEVEKTEEKKTPKIDIWKKRTVGEVFDAALQRYFERKSLRESG